MVNSPIPLDDFGSPTSAASVPIWVWIVAALVALAIILVLVSIVFSCKNGIYSQRKYEEREPLPPEVCCLISIPARKNQREMIITTEYIIQMITDSW